MFFAPSVETLDIGQQGPVTMSIRGNEGIEVLYFVAFLTRGPRCNFPSMATFQSHINNLIIKPDQ